MIEKIKNNKSLLVILCLIILILILIIFRISYAYLMERIDDGDRATINIDAEDLYALNFIPGDALNLDVTAKTLPEDNLTDLTVTSKPRVELKDPDPNNLYQYYVYLSIPTNPFVYTEEGTPEILLKIQKGEEEITQIDNLTYNTDLQAFDITTFHGTIPIRENIEVHSNGTSLTTEEWTFTLIYRNLDIDQSINLDKSLTIQVIMQEQPKELAYHVTCKDDTASCVLAKTTFTDNYMLYHDDNLANGAEDLSYRFSGASDVVNNYVCLDNLDTDSCESDDDLYRIIGIFKNEDDASEDFGQYEIKLIKAQGATTTELGDNTTATGGAYYGKYAHNKSFYKGTNYDNLISYYWNKSSSTNNENVNMWVESNLNKVNLNNYFYNYITTTKAPYLEGHITNHTWTVGGAYNTGNAKATYNYELGTNKTKNTDKRCYTQGDASTTRECSEEYDLIYPAHIGLMYLSDYMYATTQNNWTTSAVSYSNEAVRDNNWMYMGLDEWTISRSSSYGPSARLVYNTGDAGSTSGVYGNRAVRPSFYLTSDAKISKGEGSKEVPYRITFE